MTEDIRWEMKAGFKKVDDEFVAVRSEMNAGFKKVDDEFAAVRNEMKAGFKKVDDEFVAVRTEMQDFRAELKAEIRSEGETTRRHFDVVAEQFKDYVKVLADGTARNTERLDDHDQRLTALETPPGS
jgi:Skp family chaperone for outer membrane proteins